MTDEELKEEKVRVNARFRDDMTKIDVNFVENAISRLKEYNTQVFMIHKGKENPVEILGVGEVQYQVFSSSRSKVIVKVPSGKKTQVYVDSLYVKVNNQIIRGFVNG